MKFSLGDISHLGEKFEKGTMNPSVREIGIYPAVFEIYVGILRAEKVVVIVELEICEKNHALKS